MKPGTVAVGFLDPGEWAHCFGQSLIDLYLADAHGKRRMFPDGKQLRQHCHSGGIVEKRNKVMATFLDATENEWLFMVDSDMGFAPDTVEKLIESADPVERPVVGGLCFSLRTEAVGEFYGIKYIVVPTCYEWVETEQEVGFRSILGYPTDETFRVGGTGAACLLVHRSAAERVRETYGDHWFDPVVHPRGLTLSEDLSFCIRLAALDIPLHVNTAVRTTHYKGGVFLDEDEYMRSLAIHGKTREELAA